MNDNKPSTCCHRAIKLLGDLEDTFSLLAEKSSSAGMTLKDVEEWLVKAKVLDNETFKKADLEDYFKKLESNEMTFPHFQDLLKELAVKKNMDVEKLSEQLGNVQHSSDPNANLISAEDVETKDDVSIKGTHSSPEDTILDIETDKPSNELEKTLKDELEQLTIENLEDPSNTVDDE